MVRCCKVFASRLLPVQWPQSFIHVLAHATLHMPPDRFVPSGPASLPAAPPLPSAADLAAAVAALPKDVRQLYDNYYALHPAADAGVTAAAETTPAGGGSGAVRVARALGEGAAQGVGAEGKELQVGSGSW